MGIKISYMLPCYRAYYASRLLGEIARKTSDPYELLLWINMEDAGFDSYVKTLQADGYPIRVVGKTPENIGMVAFKPLIEQSKGDFLVQLEDDVLFVSKNASTVATEILSRRRDIGMISAEVWQDEISNGGHPRPEHYICRDVADQLFEGPIDGGFSVYPRRFVPQLMESTFRTYFGMGSGMHVRLGKMGVKAYKCRKMRIFHIIGASYHSLFAGMVKFEIEKYRRVGHHAMVENYEKEMALLRPRAELEHRFKAIENYHNTFSA